MVTHGIEGISSIRSAAVGDQSHHGSKKPARSCTCSCLARAGTDDDKTLHGFAEFSGSGQWSDKAMGLILSETVDRLRISHVASAIHLTTIQFYFS